MIPRIPPQINLRNSCDIVRVKLVIGYDTNARHILWGSTNCNDRGEALVEFLNSSNIEILNQGSEPNFCSGDSLEVIDITVRSFGLLESIISWGVSSEPSLLDHRYILFTLQGSVQIHLIRNPRGTNLGSFRDGLRDRLERGTQMNMKDEGGLGFAIHWVQQTPVSAFENNCPLRPLNTGRQSLKWTSELESLRRGVGRLFNKCRTDNNPHSWELYTEARRRYKKEVREASKDQLKPITSVGDAPVLSHRSLLINP